MIILSVTIFSACGGTNLDKPKNGTYKSSDEVLDGWLSQSWTFSGKDNITLTAAGGLISTKGTYTISGDKMTVTISVFGIESTSGYTITEITSKSFFIDGTKFVKQ